MFDVESLFEVKQRLSSNSNFATSLLLDDYRPTGNGKLTENTRILL